MNAINALLLSGLLGNTSLLIEIFACHSFCQLRGFQRLVTSKRICLSAVEELTALAELSFCSRYSAAW